MLRVLILGYGPMGKALLQGTLACGDFATIVGVIPWSHSEGGYNTQAEMAEAEFKSLIKLHNINIPPFTRANDYTFVQLLSRLRPDVVLVGSWGEILKPYVLQLPHVQFINCHPSLLPQYRGANPYSAAILHNESETGITFHLMDEGIDTGPILLQARLSIAANETGISLRERCAYLAELQLPVLLSQIYTQTQVALPQEGVTSSAKIDPLLGWVNWSLPPDEIERRIRALYPWGQNIVHMGKIQFTFRFARLVSVAQRHPGQAGVIIQRDGQQILVATTQPYNALVIEDIGICKLPLVLSKLIDWLWLRPGKHFDTLNTSPSLLSNEVHYRRVQNSTQSTE